MAAFSLHPQNTSISEDFQHKKVKLFTYDSYCLVKLDSRKYNRKKVLQRKEGKKRSTMSFLNYWAEKKWEIALYAAALSFDTNNIA